MTVINGDSLLYTACLKIPTFDLYNLDQITLIFGICVSKKVKNHAMHFSHLTYLVVLHYLAKQETQKLGLFS